MTVGELIAELQKRDPELPIHVWDSRAHAEVREITEITVEGEVCRSPTCNCHAKAIWFYMI